MENLSRRQFVRRAASVATITGAGSLSVRSVFAASVPQTYEVTTDVLVVGAGAAGLFAAVAAMESGVKRVMVIDKSSIPYLNSTSLSAGLITASGTEAQKAAGIHDEHGKDQLAAEIIKTGGGINNRMLVDKFTALGASAFDWLSEHGVELTPVDNASFAVRRMHRNQKFSGSAYIDVLFPEAKRLGVEIKMKTKALSLITTLEGDHVLGLYAEHRGQKIAIRAEKGVVLATGGFASNGQMADNYLLDFPGVLSSASSLSTGDGILMASKIGAGTSHMNYAAVYAYGIPTEPEKRRGVILRAGVMNLYGSITVGEDGRRFIQDEASPTSVSNAMVLKQFKKVYVIATKTQVDDFLKHEPLQVLGWSQSTFEKELAEQRIFIRAADSIQALANKLGLDAQTLSETIGRYNQYVAQGKDEEFNRRYMKGDFTKGPYYGFICQPIALLTRGGLRVDEHMNVLDVYGKSIKGLYAAGEILGGIHGSSYTGGDSLGAALTLGRLAGQSVAS